MKTRSWNFRISLLLLSCAASAVLATAPDASAVTGRLIRPRGIQTASSMDRYKSWSRLWSAPTHSTPAARPPHRIGKIGHPQAMQRPTAMKRATPMKRPTPMQYPVTAAYRKTQINIGHFIEPTPHPVTGALTRSNYPLTQQLTSLGNSSGPGFDPLSPPSSAHTTASSVFSRGGAGDPTAAKVIPAGTFQMVPAQGGITAPSLFSRPAAASGRAST